MKEGYNIRFAFKLRAVSDDNPSGLTYQATNLLKVEAIDELTSMALQIPGAVPVLSLPQAREPC